MKWVIRQERAIAHEKTNERFTVCPSFAPKPRECFLVLRGHERNFYIVTSVEAFDISGLRIGTRPLVRGTARKGSIPPVYVLDPGVNGK
jgi:hypothetical protein